MSNKTVTYLVVKPTTFDTETRRCLSLVMRIYLSTIIHKNGEPPPPTRPLPEKNVSYKRIVDPANGEDRLSCHLITSAASQPTPEGAINQGQTVLKRQSQEQLSITSKILLLYIQIQITPGNETAAILRALYTGSDTSCHGNTFFLIKRVQGNVTKPTIGMFNTKSIDIRVHS